MGVLSMRATAIVSALKWGIFVAGVLAKHTAMPITPKIEKTHPENAPLRMMANCSLRNGYATHHAQCKGGWSCVLPCDTYNQRYQQPKKWHMIEVVWWCVLHVT